MTERDLLTPKEETDRVGGNVPAEPIGWPTIGPKSIVAATRGLFAGDPEAAERLLHRVEMGEAFEPCPTIPVL